MSTEAVTAAATADHKAWVAKKIHSFVGVVPLGVYLVLHLTRNVSSLAGPEAFDAAVRNTWTQPINYLWVVLLVYLPLAFHSLYGIKLMMESEKTSVFKHFNLENVRYFFQRLSGLGVLGFLCAHIFLTRVHVSMGWLQDANTNPDGQATYAYFATHMWDFAKGTVVVYALGVLGTVYHLANGLSTFCISWGITTGKKSIKTAEIVALVFGLFLLALGYAAIVGFFLHDFNEFITPGGPLSATGILGPLMGHH
jgi:succinate dehydrogenase / fumarate reductase, cytochrome b subunit